MSFNWQICFIILRDEGFCPGNVWLETRAADESQSPSLLSIMLTVFTERRLDI